MLNSPTPPKEHKSKKLSDLIRLSSNVRLKSEFPLDLIKKFRERGLFIAKTLVNIQNVQPVEFIERFEHGSRFAQMTEHLQGLPKSHSALPYNCAGQFSQAQFSTRKEPTNPIDLAKLTVTR